MSYFAAACGTGSRCSSLLQIVSCKLVRRKEQLKGNSSLRHAAAADTAVDTSAEFSDDVYASACCTGRKRRKSSRSLISFVADISAKEGAAEGVTAVPAEVVAPAGVLLVLLHVVLSGSKGLVDLSCCGDAGAAARCLLLLLVLLAAACWSRKQEVI